MDTSILLYNPFFYYLFYYPFVSRLEICHHFMVKVTPPTINIAPPRLHAVTGSP